MAHRVLIVDDDREVRELLSAALETRGCQVEQAPTLAEARRLLAAAPVDLAIIDGFLPDGSGIAWIQELRDQGQRVRVAFLSALWRDEAILRRLTEELGVVRVLHKPLSVSSFLVQIMSVLEPAERLKVSWTPPAEAGRARRKGQVEEVPPLPAPPSRAAPEPPEEPAAGRPRRPRADALRERYLRSLLPRVEELEQTLSEALRPPGSADLLVAAVELAERIESSAAGFGLDELSQGARALARGLGAMVEGNPVGAEGVEARLARLRALAQSARSFGASQDQDRARGLYGARVLVVSPDTALLELARGRGGMLLLDMVTAQSAGEALEASAVRPPDLALLDLPLYPEGAALAEALRRLEGLSQLAVGFLEPGGALPLELPGEGPTLLLGRGLEPAELGLALSRLTDREAAAVPTVLIVDDDPNFCRVLAGLLARVGVSAATLTNPERTLGTLAELRPDLLVLDALMPRIGGLELCRVVRAQPAWDELPVVLLTGAGGRDVVMAGLEVGADDVFLKGMDPAELLARLRARLERSRLLRARSDRDAHTGLLNRRAFTEAVRGRLEECRRIRRSLAVVVLSVPELGDLARRNGARLADEVIGTAARLLVMETRSYDLRGRWGRGELVVALTGVERAAALAAVERVRERLLTLRFPGLTEPLRLHLRVGAFPEDGRTLEDVVRAAVAPDPA